MPYMVVEYIIYHPRKKIKGYFWHRDNKMKNPGKKILGLLLSAVLCLLPAAGSPSPDHEIRVNMKNAEGLPGPPDVTAAAAILLNAATGEIIYEKNIDRVLAPASTVKLMTAVVALENIPDLEGEVVVSKYVFDTADGNKLDPRAREGEVFSARDLLNAMLLRGMNDAALALAEYAAGSVTDFVALMNKKAVELGCTDTVFTNPTGLDSPDMHTTASDMAKIAFHASRIQTIMDITASPSHKIPPTNKERGERSLVNRNHFVSKDRYAQYYYEYAKGMNYGSTKAGGECLTTVAEQNELSYLCIVMNSTATPVAGSDAPRLNCFYDAKALLDWAFALYGYKTPVKKTDVVKTVKIKLAANRDEVTLCPDRDITVLLPLNVKDDEIEKVIEVFEDELVAPIEKNQQLGKITLVYNGEAVGSAYLLSLSEVEPSNVLQVLDHITIIVSGGWFKASIVIFVIVAALYVVITNVRKSKKEQRRFY